MRFRDLHNKITMLTITQLVKRFREREVLRHSLAEARRLADRHARPGILADAERIVTEAHADAVELLLQENGLKTSAGGRASGLVRPRFRRAIESRGESFTRSAEGNHSETGG